MAYKVSTELDQLFDALVGSEKQLIYEQIGNKLPHHIRFNPLKGDPPAQQRLFEQSGFQFDAVEGLKNIFQIAYQPFPIGKSLSHFLGHIYVQDIASMIPALVLDPRPGEWVLDVSAAPGSKTTLMAALMDNRGLIVANDVAGKRLKALQNNLDRMGITNTLVYKWYGEQFGNVFFESFDRVLLDPACSGIGTLHKNPEVLTWWSPAHCERLAHSQEKLLTSALKALRPGGTLVYSTCTLTPEENEQVVQFACDRYPVEVVPIRLPAGIKTWPGLTRFGERKFHPDMDKTIRLYPLDRVTEGFFVALLRKTDSMREPHPGKRKTPRHISSLTHKTSPVKKYIDYLISRFDIPEKIFKAYRYQMTTDIRFTDRSIETFPVFGTPRQMGLALARTRDHSARLNTTGAHILGRHARRNIINLEDPEILENFVNREPVDIPVAERGQYIVTYDHSIIGYGMGENGQLKSQFPKGEWPLKIIPEAE